MTLREVAVGIDESETAASALAWAGGFAAAADAALQVVHVWQTPYVNTFAGFTPSTEELKQHARSIVRDAITQLSTTQPVESVVLHGTAGPALVAQAAASDLVVVGRRGQNLVRPTPEFGEVITGSTARYCMNHGASAVATIPAGSQWTQAPSVVVGVDGSPASLAALTWATEHLPIEASIHAVVAVSLDTAEDLNVPVDAELLDPLVDRHREELRSRIAEHVSPSFTQAGRTVQPHVIVGHASDALVDPGFACDLIVMGEHGKTADAPRLLGSIAEYTLRHAALPLIVVPTTSHASH